MTAQELRDKFDRDLEALQIACEHKESEWMASSLYPGNIGPSVMVCKNCDKVLEQKSYNIGLNQ